MCSPPYPRLRGWWLVGGRRDKILWPSLLLGRVTYLLFTFARMSCPGLRLSTAAYFWGVLHFRLSCCIVLQLPVRRAFVLARTQHTNSYTAHASASARRTQLYKAVITPGHIVLPPLNSSNRHVRRWVGLAVPFIPHSCTLTPHESCDTIGPHLHHALNFLCCSLSVGTSQQPWASLTILLQRRPRC